MIMMGASGVQGFTVQTTSSIVVGRKHSSFSSGSRTPALLLPSSPATTTTTRFGGIKSVSNNNLEVVAAAAAKGDDYDTTNDDDDEEEDEDLLADSDWRDFRARLVLGENAPPSTTSGSSSSSSSSSGGSTTKNQDGEESPAVILGEDGDLDGIGSIFQDSSSSSFSRSQKMGSSSSNNTEDAAAAAATMKTLNEQPMMAPLNPSQWAYESGKIIEQGAVILGGVEQDFGFGLRQQYFHKAAILVLDHEESTFTKGIILNRPTDLTLEDDINPGVRWRVWFGGVSYLCIMV